MPERPRLIQIHPQDNVAVAVEAIEAGAELRVGEVVVRVRDPIRRGHKVALAPIGCGENVIKNGFPIGRSTSDIAPGAHIHIQNVRTNLEGILEYEYRPQFARVAPVDSPISFDGFVRGGGEVGVRNEIWIIPTVGCVNEICRKLAVSAQQRLARDNLEGVYAFGHPYGCSQFGDDLLRTQAMLAGLVRHPNAGGVLIVGLGCEHNSIGQLRQVLGEPDPRRVKYFAAQEVEDEMATGMVLLETLAEYVRGFTRQPVPLCKLRVGLKCGGSDGFSGITANPLLGVVSDRLTSMGGSTLLTEVPEMFGAETILMDRCLNREVFDKCVRLVNGFKSYLIRHQRPIYENPTPGNQDGGITTLEDKSLGCTQKSGTSPVMDVLEYGQCPKRAGLNLVNSPSNDLVSVSALVAAGAHLVLFTTGRGTPLGGPVPTVKISTTSELARRKGHWIDFDAGRLLEGEQMSALADALLDYVVQVASGRARTKNEQHGFREMAIFKDGVTG